VEYEQAALHKSKVHAPFLTLFQEHSQFFEEHRFSPKTPPRERSARTCRRLRQRNRVSHRHRAIRPQTLRKCREIGIFPVGPTVP
jgi:hypothetical protein